MPTEGLPAAAREEVERLRGIADMLASVDPDRRFERVVRTVESASLLLSRLADRCEALEAVVKARDDYELAQWDREQVGQRRRALNEAEAALAALDAEAAPDPEQTGP